ncbi:hypothetical protein A9Q84_09600 [Halobacteriovorax marinus]|uniref:Cytidylyltransferase n=1 Tax=Halobacteriovorax marinus TaxID=97084 RepID=A0A1Y5FAT4_9BACT|nr:hypothetical protein A9Q84_09600 [Halobacteriovorax marinus]
MEKYLVQIPVKKISERLSEKNTREFVDTTLLDIAIKKALEIFPAKVVYLNTDCKKAQAIASKYGICIYERNIDLCNNNVTLDTFTYDFLEQHPCENVILINTISPLLEVETLQSMIEHFESKDELSSLISGNKFLLHGFMESQAINFKNTGSIPTTQNLKDIEFCNWGYGIWNSEVFRSNFKLDQRSVLCDGFEIFDCPSLNSIKISTEKDFKEAEEIYRFLSSRA